ncbi:MAG: TonB-dependent receptor [Pseudomonadales bacterium]|nr:TonB-dependent receptor [Pseudomonadales bacterium]MCP5302784.1 TonB-dependent receptor [Pseudomonadales bacterium]
MIYKKSVLAAAIAAFTTCQFVQASQEMNTDSLEEIEVQATSIHSPHSNSMHSLDQKSIKAMISSTSDTASLLGKVPGVNLYSAGGVSSLPAIHGLADDRLRIKVDGMDLISACGNHMNPPLSYIGASNVGSAQVFTSIVPVSIGGDSIGGSIQVDSLAPEFASNGESLFKGEAGTFYRSNGDAQGVNIAMTFAGERLNLSYQGSMDQADNYSAADNFKPAGPAAAGRGSLDNDEVGSSMYKSTNQSLKLGLRIDKNHLVQLKLGVQDIPYQGWPNQRMDMTDNDSKQASIKYEGQYGWGILEAQAYYEQTRHKMQFYDDKLYWYGPNNIPGSDGTACIPAGGMNGCAAGMPMDTEGENIGFSIKGNITLSQNNLLRVGIESQQYTLDDWWDPSGKGMWPNVFWNINNGQRDRLALFAEWESHWSDQWLTQLGVRHEEVKMNADEIQGYSPLYSPAAEAAFNTADRDKTDHNFDITLLARFTPSPRQSYEFGLAQKTRSPNLYERYSWSTHGMSMRMINMVGDGNGYVGNLALDPEVAYRASFTADWHDVDHQHWGIKLTAYYTHIEDYIDAERCAVALGGTCSAGNLTETSEFVYLQFVNQRARLYGLDLSGHLALVESQKYGNLEASGVIAYLDGENDKTGDNLYNIMPLNAKFALHHRLAGWTTTAEMEFVDQKDEVSQVRNELKTSGFGLFHLRGSYEWKQLRVDIGIENLFDKFYNDPLGGAYTGQGKTMSGTGIAWGTPVPGMGRSVYAGVNLKF